MAPALTRDNRGGERRRATVGEHQAEYPCRLRYARDRAEVLGVFDAVECDERARGSAFWRRGEQLLEPEFGQRSDLKLDARGGQPFGVGIRDLAHVHPDLARARHELHQTRMCRARAHVESPQLAAPGSERLADRMDPGQLLGSGAAAGCAPVAGRNVAVRPRPVKDTAARPVPKSELRAQRLERFEELLGVLHHRMVEQLELRVRDELSECGAYLALAVPRKSSARSITTSGSSAPPGPNSSPASSCGWRSAASRATSQSRWRTGSAPSIATTGAVSSASSRTWVRTHSRSAVSVPGASELPAVVRIIRSAPI